MSLSTLLSQNVQHLHTVSEDGSFEPFKIQNPWTQNIRVNLNTAINNTNSETYSKYNFNQSEFFNLEILRPAFL